MFLARRFPGHSFSVNPLDSAVGSSLTIDEAELKASQLHAVHYILLLIKSNATIWLSKILQQSASSLLSSQSLRPSHRLHAEMHWPVAQRNWLSGHATHIIATIIIIVIIAILFSSLCQFSNAKQLSIIVIKDNQGDQSLWIKIHI